MSTEIRIFIMNVCVSVKLWWRARKNNETPKQLNLSITADYTKNVLDLSDFSECGIFKESVGF